MTTLLSFHYLVMNIIVIIVPLLALSRTFAAPPLAPRERRRQGESCHIHGHSGSHNTKEAEAIEYEKQDTQIELQARN